MKNIDPSISNVDVKFMKILYVFSMYKYKIYLYAKLWFVFLEK